jgi:hypothetical protein
VVFRYDSVADSARERAVQRQGFDYPSRDGIERYCAELEKTWRPIEMRVFHELSDVARLPWVDESIVCTVLGNCVPYSRPLRIPVYREVDEGVDVLVHELIHQLFCQTGNGKRAESAWKHIRQKYANQTGTTQVHIPLHAIHKHIYLKLFDENRLKRDQKNDELESRIQSRMGYRGTRRSSGHPERIYIKDHRLSASLN